jgi:hypothetical protein
VGALSLRRGLVRREKQTLSTEVPRLSTVPGDFEWCINLRNVWPDEVAGAGRLFSGRFTTSYRTIYARSHAGIPFSSAMKGSVRSKPSDLVEEGGVCDDWTASLRLRPRRDR